MAPSSHIEEIQKLRADEQIRIQGGKQYEEHLDKVAKLMGSSRIQDLARLANDGALDALDPYLDTIPYLLILQAHVKTLWQGRKAWPDELKPGAPSWAKIVAFLQQANPIELRPYGKQWTDLVNHIFGSARHTSLDGQPVPVIPHIVAALLHLDPSGNTLTTTHYELVREAHQQQCPLDVIPALDKHVTNLPTKKGAGLAGHHWLDADCPACEYITIESGFTDRLVVEQVQEYFTLGALAYIQARNWRRAIFFLEHVLATPISSVANGYMVEAYSKWVLLNLIQHGQVASAPRTIPQNMLKHIRNMCKPYDALKDAYGKADGSKLLAEAMVGDKTWRDDGNVGLVQRVLADHKRRCVTKLGQVYAAVPLETVAERLGMNETQVQTYLSRLVNEGAVEAQLEQSPLGSQILRFRQNSSKGASAEAEVKLHTQLVDRTRRLKELAEAISNADQQLSLSREYVEHARKARRNKESRFGVGEEDGTINIASNAMGSDDDEELMVDAN